MPKFEKIAGLYEPEGFSSADYVEYARKKLAVETTENAISAERLSIQPRLQEILDMLVESISRHPRFATPIFIEVAAVDTEFYNPTRPFTRALYDLMRLKVDNEQLLSLVDIKRVLENLISAFETNELSYGFAKDFRLLTQHLPTVTQARVVGGELKTEFTPIIKQLKTIEHESLLPLQEQLSINNTALAEAGPQNVSERALKQARFNAIAKIHKLADTDAKAGNAEAAGIRGACSELQAKTHDNVTQAHFDQIVSGFRPLQNRKPNGYADKKIALLKQILIAHNNNLVTISSDYYAEEAFREAKERLDAAPAKLFPIKKILITKDSKKSDELVVILNAYLTKRSAVVDKKQQTKNYYCSFFTCFQKSYSQKQNAVAALKLALAGDINVDLQPHLATLRDGQLGKQVRAYIKAGHANAIVGEPVNTVRAFIRALQVNLQNTPKLNA